MILLHSLALARICTMVRLLRVARSCKVQLEHPIYRASLLSTDALRLVSVYALLCLDLNQLISP